MESKVASWVWEGSLEVWKMESESLNSFEVYLWWRVRICQATIIEPQESFSVVSSCGWSPTPSNNKCKVPILLPPCPVHPPPPSKKDWKDLETQIHGGLTRREQSCCDQTSLPHLHQLKTRDWKEKSWVLVLWGFPFPYWIRREGGALPYPSQANEGGPPADKDSAAAGGEACTAMGEVSRKGFP